MAPQPLLSNRTTTVSDPGHGELLLLATTRVRAVTFGAFGFLWIGALSGTSALKDFSKSRWQSSTPISSAVGETRT